MSNLWCLTLLLSTKGNPVIFLALTFINAWDKLRRALAFSADVMHEKSCNSKCGVDLSIFQQIQRWIIQLSLMFIMPLTAPCSSNLPSWIVRTSIFCQFVQFLLLGDQQRRCISLGSNPISWREKQNQRNSFLMTKLSAKLSGAV